MQYAPSRLQLTCVWPLSRRQHLVPHRSTISGQPHTHTHTRTHAYAHYFRVRDKTTMAANTGRFTPLGLTGRDPFPDSSHKPCTHAACILNVWTLCLRAPDHSHSGGSKRTQKSISTTRFPLVFVVFQRAKMTHVSWSPLICCCRWQNPKYYN